MLARRCNASGLVTMPARTTVPPKQKPTAKPPKLTVGNTRKPLRVIATGLLPDITTYRGFKYVPGSHFDIDPADAPELVAKGLVQVVEDLPTPDWWTAAGRILLTEPGEAQPYTSKALAGSLRIVHGTDYDPGNACFRFHTALNETTKHTSAFVRYLVRENNPFNCPTQYDGTKDPAMVRALLQAADVVHQHMEYRLTRNVGLSDRPRAGQVLVRHYHGTQFDPHGKPYPHAMQRPIQQAMLDDANFAVIVGARLTLCALRPGRIQWLPITVPVARYGAMVAPKPPRVAGMPLRVAHSPTKSILKGTRDFVMVCKRLRARGVPIEPVMIERKHHAAALVLKATADACFDAFALGIQGSGLEAAAMGQPVVAGDAEVAALYRAEMGHVPYTFAPTWQQLEAQLERLAMDPVYYEAEAARVNRYVVEYHDYAAVARRYEDILVAALGREDVRTKEKKKRPPKRVA